ncbi:riboflavin synthase [Brevundimonas sp. 2R-24]|uniref:Riboflavin synthase n=1 Tax=Peiella sedimenti TaxID=3061083 RepID=A0ABT8SJE7_9CAUL|nr:riboflavin synthase [Caulobacteraceae bacterium XZ-24]
MFTGIVTHVGQVRAVADTARDRRYEIAVDWDASSLAIGASVAHAGCCLTIVEKLDGAHVVEASAETLSKTTLGGWAPGARVNLERALKVGDELGGHMVTGHVDGLARVLDIAVDGGSHRLTLEAPEGLHRLIAAKGSVALEGVSLTVNAVEDRRFTVNLIPHTWRATTLSDLKPGEALNLEVDPLARYLARWRETA